MAVFLFRKSPVNTVHYLEYIQSSGTQYVDTGFTPNQDTRILMEAQIIGNPEDHEWFYGARTSGSVNAYGFFWNHASSKFGGTYGNQQVDVSEDVPVSTKIFVDQNKNVLLFNQNTYTFLSTTFTCPVTLPLLARNTNGTIATYANAKLYFCQIYDNGTLIRDYYPARDKEGIVCLYDQVNKEYVYNSGTGGFIAGPDA